MGVDHLDVHHAIANRLRRDDGPGERVAMGMVKVADPDRPFIELGQREFFPFLLAQPDLSREKSCSFSVLLAPHGAHFA